jgi:hypothetical protein
MRIRVTISRRGMGEGAVTHRHPISCSTAGSAMFHFRESGSQASMPKKLCRWRGNVVRSSVDVTEM